VRVKIVAQLEHDQLTPSGLMVHDHHPADPDRQIHRCDLRGPRLPATGAKSAISRLDARSSRCRHAFSVVATSDGSAKVEGVFELPAGLVDQIVGTDSIGRFQVVELGVEASSIFSV
jgi:hypothetical protein